MSRPRSTTEGRLTQIVLIVLALAFLGVFLLLPLIVVFSEALKQGLGPFLDAVHKADALAAIKLTLLIAAISVPLNMVFGAHRDTLAERPDMVRTMLDIHRKATEFAAGNREAMIAMAVSKLGQKREALELSAPNVELTWRLGPDEVRQAGAYAQHMLALKQIKRLPEPGFIDTRFVDAMSRA